MSESIRHAHDEFAHAFISLQRRARRPKAHSAAAATMPIAANGIQTDRCGSYVSHNILVAAMGSRPEEQHEVERREYGGSEKKISPSLLRIHGGVERSWQKHAETQQ